MLPCSSYLPLGVPNGSLLCEHQALFLAPLPGNKQTSQLHLHQAWSTTASPTATAKKFFGRRCRGEEALLQGESLTSNLFTLLLFCLFYFLLPCYIKNTQKISCSFYSCCLVLILLEWVLLLRIPSCVISLAPTIVTLYAHLLRHLLPGVR